MGAIKDDFNRMLFDDYNVSGTGSVVYKHYVNELKEAAERNTGSSKTRLSSAGRIYQGYRRLGNSPMEKEVFDFLKEVFVILGDNSDLYDQPLYAVNPEENRQKRAENEEKLSKNGSRSSLKEIHRNDTEDYNNILKILWPYLAPALGLSREEKAVLGKNCIKSRLRARVRELAKAVKEDPEKVYAAYENAGLLRKNSELSGLYNHIMRRSVDKSYKDYLYTEGYTAKHLYNNISYTGNEGDAGSKLVKLPEGKGRSNAKPDKMFSLLDEICRTRGIFSLTGDALDDPDLTSAVTGLYEYICDFYEGEEDFRFSLILAADPYTGVSLQLVGNSYTGSKEPCSFVVIYRHDDDYKNLYYDDSEDERAVMKKALSSGEEKADALGLFESARADYRLAVKTALDSIHEGNEAYADDLSGIGGYEFFAYSLTGESGADEEDECLAETLEYIRTPYDDEK